MKLQLKTVLIVGAMTIVAGIIMFMESSQQRRNPASRALLIPEEMLSALEAIEVSSMEAVLTIHREDDDRWFVSHKEGERFAVDALKLAQLLDDLARVKVQRSFSDENSEMSDMGFDHPVKITLRSEQVEPLTVEIGAHRPGGGQYIRTSQSAMLFLVDKPLSISADIANWELKTIVDVASEKLSEIIYKDQAGHSVAALSRGSVADEWKLEGLADGKKLHAARLREATQLLQGLTYTKRVDADNAQAKAALSSARQVSISLLDGRSFELRSGSIGEGGDKKHYLAIRARAEGNVADTPEGRDAELVNELASKWVFEVSRIFADKIHRQRTDFEEPIADVATSP